MKLKSHFPGLYNSKRSVDKRWHSQTEPDDNTIGHLKWNTMQGFPMLSYDRNQRK